MYCQLKCGINALKRDMIPSNSLEAKKGAKFRNGEKLRGLRFTVTAHI